jgi:tripartite-type tricarboxylate transporter receptor subunit TctC
MALTVGMSPGFAQSERASDFPNKQVRIIVPYTPGGVTDVLMRVLAQKMSENMGQPVVVENRPGGNAMIGTDLVAKANPDGYTLGAITAAHAVNPVLVKNVPYHAIDSFSPVSLVGSAPLIIVVSANSEYKTIQDLSKALRQPGNKLSYGAGTPAIHLMTQLFLSGIGGTALHVPYKGTTGVQTDLIGGTLSFTLDTTTGLLPNIRGGKLRALAATSLTRYRGLPDVPSVAEAVLPQYDVRSWQGIIAPKGTPKNVIDRLNAEVLRALRTPEVMEKMNTVGIEPIGSTPQALNAQISTEIGHWQGIAQKVGLKAE